MMSKTSLVENRHFSSNSIIRIGLSQSATYLLACQNGYLQIDTGYDWDYPAYRKLLAHMGIDLQEIKFLLLTHHHDDHAGFLNELTCDTSVQIIAHRAAVDLLKGGANDKTHGGGYVNRFIKVAAGLKMRLNPRWTLTFPPFTLRKEDILLDGDDDQLLRRIGVPGLVLYTPGHCIDALSLVLETGEAFCGDAAANFLVWAGTRYCTVFMTDMEAAYRSWQKLLDAGARVIFPAHGRTFSASQLEKNMGRIQTADLVSFF
jgi:glyoxylase-like metal-dependent hydrolase (beta-lactamase superfamily II)